MDFRRRNAPKVHDVASHVFWHHAAEHGVPDTISLVEEGKVTDLFKSPRVKALLNTELAQVPVQFRPHLLNAVADEIQEHVRDGQQLSGIVYGEDAATGRSPSAQPLVTQHLNIPFEGIDQAAEIETLGMLCLRAPLPAVVFAQREPSAPIVRIGDTQRALGFQYPLFMHVLSTSPGVPDYPIILRGIFHIPVPSAEHGEEWRPAILNFTGFMDTLTFYGEHLPQIPINVRWPG